MSKKKTKTDKYDNFLLHVNDMIYSWDYCRKSGSGGPGYEMRWAPAEDFMELKVMPRMLLDHLPDNVYKVLDTILREQKDNVSEII